MEKTGLRFNTGKLKWGLVSWKALGPMVQVLQYGAHKYTTFKTDKLFKGAPKTMTGAEVDAETAKDWPVLTSGANNWKGGLTWTGVAESLLRHVHALLEGEDNDPESKLAHVGHILCNAMFLSYMFLFRKDLDDRHIDKNLKNDDKSGGASCSKDCTCD